MDTVNERIFNFWVYGQNGIRMRPVCKTLKQHFYKPPFLPSTFNEISSCVFHGQVSQSLVTLLSALTLAFYRTFNPYEKKCELQENKLVLFSCYFPNNIAGLVTINLSWILQRIYLSKTVNKNESLRKGKINKFLQTTFIIVRQYVSRKKQYNYN